MILQFYKMHGLGNDFVIIDSRGKNITISQEDIRKISDRKKGVGCDQLIIIRDHEAYDCYIEIFNNNGSKAEVCGNATRCVARLLKKNSVEILSSGRVLKALSIGDDKISVNMGLPYFGLDLIPVSKFASSPVIAFDIEGFEKGIVVNVGNPHLIFFKDEIGVINVRDIGSFFEKNDLFPKGINVSFAKIVNIKTIDLRVWERGAGETLACGTAACATFAAARYLHHVDSSVIVNLPGGSLCCAEDEQGNIHMSGETKLSFYGEISID